MPKQAVGARECLNDVLVFQLFVQIECVYPLGIKAREHLIDNNKQVNLLICLYALVGCLMGKARRHVLFKAAVSAKIKGLVIASVVVGDDFFQSGFLERCCRPVAVVDVRVKDGRDFQLRLFLFEKTVIGNGLWYAACGKQRVEFARVGEHHPVFKNIRDNLFCVLVTRVLALGQVVFNALHIFAGLAKVPGHGNVIHESVVDFALVRVGNGFFLGCGLCLVERNSLAHVLVLVGEHLIGVKAKHVFIAYAVGNTVSVQFVAKNIGSCAALDLVFDVNGRAGKAKKDRVGKVLLYIMQHVAKGGAVCLIHDKDNTLVGHLFDICGVHAAFLLDVAHLLYGGDDERIG